MIIVLSYYEAITNNKLFFELALVELERFLDIAIKIFTFRVKNIVLE